MKTQELISPKYGITERKKTELDALAIQVADAQYNVDQLQAIATALGEKSQNFQAYLATADANKAQALTNRDLLDQVVQNAGSLQDNSKRAFGEIVNSDKKAKVAAYEIKNMIDKLIYAAELINKLSNVVTRTKAMNPLVSDDLVARIAAAGKDANNAVALALVALKSTFAAQAVNQEAEATTVLEYQQATDLYDVLISGYPGDAPATGPDGESLSKSTGDCLQGLLYNAYTQAEQAYNDATKANKDTIKELNAATASLNKAQIKLKSLQLGLSAANAAAMAS